MPSSAQAHASRDGDIAPAQCYPAQTSNKLGCCGGSVSDALCGQAGKVGFTSQGYSLYQSSNLSNVNPASSATSGAQNFISSSESGNIEASSGGSPMPLPNEPVAAAQTFVPVVLVGQATPIELSRIRCCTPFAVSILSGENKEEEPERWRTFWFI